MASAVRRGGGEGLSLPRSRSKKMTALSRIKRLIVKDVADEYFSQYCGKLDNEENFNYQKI